MEIGVTQDGEHGGRPENSVPGQSRDPRLSRPPAPRQRRSVEQGHFHIVSSGPRPVGPVCPLSTSDGLAVAEDDNQHFVSGFLTQWYILMVQNHHELPG